MVSADDNVFLLFSRADCLLLPDSYCGQRCLAALDVLYARQEGVMNLGLGTSAGIGE